MEKRSCGSCSSLCLSNPSGSGQPHPLTPPPISIFPTSPPPSLTLVVVPKFTLKKKQKKQGQNPFFNNNCCLVQTTLPKTFKEPIQPCGHTPVPHPPFMWSGLPADDGCDREGPRGGWEPQRRHELMAYSLQRDSTVL